MDPARIVDQMHHIIPVHTIATSHDMPTRAGKPICSRRHWSSVIRDFTGATRGFRPLLFTYLSVHMGDSPAVGHLQTVNGATIYRARRITSGAFLSGTSTQRGAEVVFHQFHPFFDRSYTNWE